MNSDPESKPKKKRKASAQGADARGTKEVRFTRLAPKNMKERQNVLLSFLIQVDIDQTEQQLEEEREAPTNFMKVISAMSPTRKPKTQHGTHIPSISPKTKFQ